MAERLVGHLLIAVRPFADGKVAALALIAFAAIDGEGHDYAIASLEAAVHLGPGLDHFAHHLMAHDVAWFHRWYEVVEQVKVGAADRAARNLDDGIARMLDF